MLSSPKRLICILIVFHFWLKVTLVLKSHLKFPKEQQRTKTGNNPLVVAKLRSFSVFKTDFATTKLFFGTPARYFHLIVVILPPILNAQ